MPRYYTRYQKRLNEEKFYQYMNNIDEHIYSSFELHLEEIPDQDYRMYFDKGVHYMQVVIIITNELNDIHTYFSNF